MPANRTVRKLKFLQAIIRRGSVWVRKRRMIMIETFYTTMSRTVLVGASGVSSTLYFNFDDCFLLTDFSIFHTIPTNRLSVDDHIKLNGWLSLTSVSIFHGGKCYYTTNAFTAMGTQKTSPLRIKGSIKSDGTNEDTLENPALTARLNYPQCFFSNDINTILIGVIVGGNIYRKVVV